jgi:hypothetical protein
MDIGGAPSSSTVRMIMEDDMGKAFSTNGEKRNALYVIGGESRKLRDY